MTATRMTVMTMVAFENASRSTRQDEQKRKQLFHSTLNFGQSVVNNSQVRYSKSPATAALKSLKPNAQCEWARDWVHPIRSSEASWRCIILSRSLAHFDVVRAAGLLTGGVTAANRSLPLSGRHSFAHLLPGSALD